MERYELEVEWCDVDDYVANYTKKRLKTINKCINKYKSFFYCILNNIVLMRINRVY